MNNKKSIGGLVYYLIYLVVVWSIYRSFFTLPSDIEEIIIKPLIWLLPVFYLLRKEGLKVSYLGLNTKKIFPSIYLSMLLGFAFALEGLMVNFLKYDKFEFKANIGTDPFIIAIVLSLATAITEEITFRGYIFKKLFDFFNNEWKANILSSFLWSSIHIPIGIFVWQMGPTDLLGYLLLTIIFGIGSAFVFARTKNILSPILLHFFWEWPIVLFR